VAFAPASLMANGWSATLDRELVDACECRNDLLWDRCLVAFGSDCSSNVSSIVVGESDFIAKPWRST
jgi:hypothetical protein